MYKQVKLPPNGIVEGIIQRLSDGVFIPFSEGNKDYQQYLKWLDGYELQNNEWVKTSDGNTPEPADE